MDLGSITFHHEADVVLGPREKLAGELMGAAFGTAIAVMLLRLLGG